MSTQPEHVSNSPEAQLSRAKKHAEILLNSIPLDDEQKQGIKTKLAEASDLEVVEGIISELEGKILSN